MLILKTLRVTEKFCQMVKKRDDNSRKILSAHCSRSVRIFYLFSLCVYFSVFASINDETSGDSKHVTWSTSKTTAWGGRRRNGWRITTAPCSKPRCQTPQINSRDDSRCSRWVRRSQTARGCSRWWRQLRRQAASESEAVFRNGVFVTSELSSYAGGCVFRGRDRYTDDDTIVVNRRPLLSLSYKLQPPFLFPPLFSRSLSRMLSYPLFNEDNKLGKVSRNKYVWERERVTERERKREGLSVCLF